MTRSLIAPVLIALAPSLALAQSSAEGGARVVKDKRSAALNEIERGFYFGITAGGWFLVNPPANAAPGATSAVRPFSSGQMAQVEVGRDFGDRLSVAGFVMGTTNRAGADYIGKSGGLASGDFSSIIPGGVVRANLLGFMDDQDVKRTWIYLRAGAGFAMFSPKTLLPDPDVLVFGGPGVEYYTRLRHFSIGIEASGALLLTQGTFGFAITPNLRYAF